MAWRDSISIVDATLSGGSAEVSAIDNVEGVLFARNIASSGYASAVSNDGAVVPGDVVEELVSDPIMSQFASPQKSLGLHVEETPVFHDDDMSHWVDVKAHGAIPGDDKDDTAGIQKAIDEAAKDGLTTIYITGGDYHVGDRIRVHGSIRRIIGAYTFIKLTSGHTFTDAASPKPMWRFENLTGDTVTMERFRLYDTSGLLPGLTAIEIATPKTVVLRDMATDMGCMASITNTPHAGKLFLENVVAGLELAHPQKVWARQWNFETTATESTNVGGMWWIRGYKTEKAKTLKTSAGGWTELLGGMLYANKPIAADVAAFVNDESSVTLAYTEASDAADRFFTQHMRETRGGETKTMVHEDPMGRGYGSFMPLYVGYEKSPPVEDPGAGGGSSASSGSGGAPEDSTEGAGCACTTAGDEGDLLPTSALTVIGAALAGWRRRRARRCPLLRLRSRPDAPRQGPLAPPRFDHSRLPW